MNLLCTITVITVISILSTGCIPTIIGAVAYNSGKKKESRSQFMANFNQTNLEREKAGLPPLDLCTEKYNFDEGWANNDPVCAERIEKYKAGDTSALGTPELETAETNQDSNKNVDNQEMPMAK